MVNKTKKSLLIALIIFIGLILWSASRAQVWHGIEDGIEKATIDDNIWVFKIDQNQYRFKVVGSNTKTKTLPKWAKHSTGGTNLNMFVPGFIPKGFTKLEGKIIQPKSAKYNAFMVWDEDTLMIMDRTIHSSQDILAWPNISQNIRMIIPVGERNRWKELTKIWSVSTLAIDKEGNILLIHTRSPYNMREFCDILLDTELGIQYMVYLEGGPESSIAIFGDFTNPMTKHMRMGSYETDFNENDDNMVFWNIPWALVFNRK